MCVKKYEQGYLLLWKIFNILIPMLENDINYDIVIWQNAIQQLNQMN